MNKINKTLIWLPFRNTLLGFFITVFWFISIDLYMGAGILAPRVWTWSFYAACFAILVFLLNLFYLVLLIKKVRSAVWSTMIFMHTPCVLSIIAYNIGLAGSNITVIFYTFLIVNFLLAAIFNPLLIRKIEQSNDWKAKRTVYFLVIGICLFLIVFKPKVREIIYNRNKVYPPEVFNIIDNSYKPAEGLDKTTYLNINFKPIQFYSVNEQYFDSLAFEELRGDIPNFGLKFRELKEQCTKFGVQPKLLNSSINYYKDTMYLALAKDEEVKIDSTFRGMYLYLINATSYDLELPSIDGSLYIHQQAKDFLGNWYDIDQSPKSWCGNSYYDITLTANHYLKVLVPGYDGGFETELRFSLSIEDNTILYSNSYLGKVNIGQFFIYGGYSPRGIMDPNY